MIILTSHMSKKVIFSFFLFVFFLFPAKIFAQSISNITVLSNSVREYEKYEVHFNVNTVSQYPFFIYDENPPPGVIPRVGITVEGIFTAPSGKILRQPAFYMTETVQGGNSTNPTFTETNKKYWVVRFSPQEVGTYQVQITARDQSGTVTAPVGSFTATAPAKKGFIKVSENDSRYFEFSNGDLFWPIGPAWGNDYAKLAGTGQNLERPWMGGRGAYSTNWARWKSSAENFGNEGMMTRLNYLEHLPGHDLSYELFYPEGYRFWLTTWEDDCCGPRLISGKKYRVKLTYKAVNVTGPRNSSYPFGFIVKTYTPDIMWNSPTIDQFETALRSGQNIISSYVTGTKDWTTVTADFIPNANRENIYLYLDNVTGGQVYIDEFSMQEIDSSGNIIGGEVVRNPRADEHTYVEARPAAFFDWQVQQAENNSVFLKYVVHDKNDWIQNHLLTTGVFADEGDGYYQPENTKARWLLRQWYRYLAARWGYSTAIHSWELNNEGPPNSTGGTPPTAPHWQTAQAFANYMHTIDAHPHLATTSFWCCWRPDFWGNNTLFGDIDYADLHKYNVNAEKDDKNYTYEDTADWLIFTSLQTWQSHVGKPVIWAEAGLSNTDYSPLAELKNPNPGIWYHNFLWAQLNYGGISIPNYWYSEHFSKISPTKEQISLPFYNFIKDLDLNKGGYTDVAATTTNTLLRAVGQKNLSKNEAHFWVQNKNHTWKKVMDGVSISPISANVSFNMNPNTPYTVQWWNTTNGSITGTQSLNSNSSGVLTLAVNNLSDDLAVKVSSSSTPSPTPACSLKSRGDADCNGIINILDFEVWRREFLGIDTTTKADFDSSGGVTILDFEIWRRGFLGI